jgi:hypothetical protein
LRSARPAPQYAVGATGAAAPFTHTNEDNMKRFISTATLAWLLAACAQPGTQTSAGAADPQAAVPATRYQPAIEGQAAPAPATTPDQGWRDANATVGGRNPMQLTMPGMGGDEHRHDAAPADTGKTIPLHEHHAGMDMQGMQCMAGGDGMKEGNGMQCMSGSADMKGMQGMQCMADGKCGCCAGKDKAHAHAGHADMAKGGGCCCGQGERPGQPAACKPGGTCGCCNHKGAT